MDNTTTTDKRDALTKAFRTLRKLGYFARQNFWCCQSCAWNAVPDDKAKRAVFYHNQDAADLRTRRQCYLAWAGDGQQIVDTLRLHGVVVEWDGKPTTRILVKV